jgi:Na+/melibiose symporter-like transporter
MIITCKREIPFRWIFFAILPWASIAYTGGVAGVAFVFSLKKFVENPAGLTFILSLPTFISMVTGPCTSFMSDRIWTRFGRRKPFIITSWIGMGLCLVLMPLMANFWSLVVTYIAYGFFSDLNSPIDPLQQEITPPQERGRSTGAMQWCWNLANITFYFVALGRFDDVRYMNGVTLSGETVIYWSGALLLSVMLLLIMLGIKEIDQKSSLVGERLSFQSVFGGILDQELWPVYMLVLGAAALGSGLGPLSNLLYTDQWAYSKQDMGINMAAGGVINIFIIGLLTIFADKLNRMRAYQTLIVLSVIVNLSYFCYVTFLLPDQRPSLIEIITFGETGSIIGLLTGMVYFPLVYDYIRRNKLGTYVAGANLINRLTAFITINGVGLFIWIYALWFQPPAGEMTRVVLRDQYQHQDDVLPALQSQPWVYPGDNTIATRSAITATAWQANGAVSATGRCWEVRLRDPSSEELAATRERLEQQESLLLGNRASVNHLGAGASIPTHSPSGEKNPTPEELSQDINGIDSSLAQRAQAFQQSVTGFLKDRMIADGDQILDAKMGQVLLMELPTTTRPEARELESVLRLLREQYPEIVDLRPVKLDSGYGITVSALMDESTREYGEPHFWQTAVMKAAAVKAPGLLTTGVEPAKTDRASALTLNLLLVEEPLDTYVSPINRVFNLVLALFDREPRPDHRLISLEQNLRSSQEIDQLRVRPGPLAKTILVTALLPHSPAKAPEPGDPVTQKLQQLLGQTSTPDTLAQARDFYDRIVKSAAAEKLTVARPIIVSSYAPMKYNYMSGYLWMLLMGLVGIGLTFVFSRLEAQGRVRKVGAEEAQESS